jgi:hypothetical protein
MLKIRYLSVCIFLCGILSTARAFSVDYFSTALRLFSEKKYYPASIEFERSIFYESDYVKIARSRYYKSLCYKYLDNYPGAIRELSEINLFSLPDSLFFLVRYEQSVCSFLNREPEKSLLFLGERYGRYSDTLEISSIIPLNVLCLNSCRKWDEAEKLILRYLDISEIGDSLKNRFIEEVKSLYQKKHIPGYRIPERAENFSRFIPGSGQAYCGRPGEGAVNFGLNAVVLAFTLYEFYTRYYITAYVAGLTVLNKTYNGGIHRAGILANEVNTKNMNAFNREADLLLQDIMVCKKNNGGNIHQNIPLSISGQVR